MKRETKSNTAGQELTNQTKQGQEQENPYMGTWGRETHKTQEHRTDKYDIIYAWKFLANVIYATILFRFMHHCLLLFILHPLVYFSRLDLLSDLEKMV